MDAILAKCKQANTEEIFDAIILDFSLGIEKIYS